MLNTTPITPKELPAALEVCHQAELSPMLWGPPGVGKTSVVQQFAAHLKGDLKDVRLTQIEAVDLKGICVPNYDSRTTTWLPPDFLPKEKGNGGVIFLDELTGAEQRLQVSAYSLLLERRVGDYTVPDGWMVCAAGNGIEHGAVCYEMGTALADRLVHFNVVADPKSFIDWGTKSGRIAPEVLTFIQTRSQFLDGCQERISGGALIGPSPRGWERVSRVLSKTTDDRLRQLVITGIVGESAAAEFFFVVNEMKDLVSAEDLLKADPVKRLKLMPRQLTSLYGLCYALTSYATNAQTIGGAAEIVNIMDKLSEEDPSLPIVEIKTLAMELLLEKAYQLGGNVLNAVVQTPAYIDYETNREKMKAAATIR